MTADRFDHFFIAPQSFDAALAFYRETLGWEVVHAWGSATEPRGAILDGGGVKLVLAEQHAAADRSWSQGINGVRPTLHLRVADLDARFAQLAATATVVVPIEATHWGTRWFVVKDPDDNLIAFEQPSAAPPGPG
jgi:uncharacterized glyoxalase superfamily protein PhnB